MVPVLPSWPARKIEQILVGDRESESTACRIHFCPPHTLASLPDRPVPLSWARSLTKPDGPFYSLNAGAVIPPLDGPEITFPPARASCDTLPAEGTPLQGLGQAVGPVPVGVSGEAPSRSSVEDVFTIERVET